MMIGDAPRTSHSHPLRIAVVTPGPGLGRIGITFCPGKKQPHSSTGHWDRDLGIDLDTIQAWGAKLVLTLVEQEELNDLQVAALGEDVERRHMMWRHMPIVDVSTPTEVFETRWAVEGEGIRALLRGGFDVVVHCKGGLGRAGIIAARLLIEFGMAAQDAIAAVRQVRPGAIETRGQELYLEQFGVVPERRPSLEHSAMEDRAVGALLGLAVGDAIGTTLEFALRDDAAPRLTDMVGGGPFGLKPGEWTDDTSMALALASSLASTSEFDPVDLMERFVAWHERGDYSSNGRCFDIGNTTFDALRTYRLKGSAFAGSDNPMSAGNGSLMRLAPVAIRFAGDDDARSVVAAAQSRTTHAAEEAVDACVFFADLLADAILGRRRSEVLRRRDVALTPAIAEIAKGAWRSKRRADIRGSGYVVEALEAALWCVGTTTTFADAVLRAANLREDADTTAAIAGQLAGTLYGASGIPEAWRRQVVQAEKIAGLASQLFTRGLRASRFHTGFAQGG